MMVPGPAQAAAVVALDDDAAVAVQRRRYQQRLASWLRRCRPGRESRSRSRRRFYLWFRVGDAWRFAERLAADGGALVSPGEFYGDAGREYVHVAAVQPDAVLSTLASRLGVTP